MANDEKTRLLSYVKEQERRWKSLRKGIIPEPKTIEIWVDSCLDAEAGIIALAAEAVKETEVKDDAIKAVIHIENVLSAAIARPSEIAVDWKEFLLKFVKEALKGK